MDVEVKPVVPKRKVSQRPSLSCTECSRAKIRCDKTVPCQPCIKKGKSHLCRTQPHITHKEKQLTEEVTSESSSSDPNSARLAAFTELEAFRTTVDLLRSKIAGLEALLASAFTATSSSISVGGGGPLRQSSSHPPSPYFYQLPPAASTSASSFSSVTQNQSYSAHPLPPTQEHDVTAPTTREGSSSRDSSSNVEALRGEEVEASVALEFMALGRHHRALGTSTHEPAEAGEQKHRLGGSAVAASFPSDHIDRPDLPSPSSPDGSANLLPSPTALYPTIASLAAAAPRRPEADAIIAHSLDWLGWHHSAVCAPIFKREVDDFWSWGEERMQVCNPAWLALWFSLLVVGVGNLAHGQAPHLGITEDERTRYARKWFDCAMSCLYRANFLQNHSIFAVQAITVLVVSCQDAASSNIIPTLLSSGIAIAQDMGMHRMNSDHEWEVSMSNQPHQLRVKSLLMRETRKRVLWALTTQDWFNIPYRRTYVIQPTQVTTPLPINATDEDLISGYLVNRPPDEYTIVSKQLLWIQVARCLQSVFEHIDKNAEPVYEFVLEVDAHLASVIDNCPSWMLDDGPTEGMPPCVNWVRNTFRISSNHKVLALHRPFLHRAFQDPRYESSRKRAITASRNILREAGRASDNRVWTVPYHIAAGACVVLLDLFQRAGSTSPSLEEERNEVMGALHALELMQETSSIAKRGVALITSLVAEERRLRDERARAGPVVRARKRGPTDLGEGREYSQAAKKFALSEISPPPSNPTTPSEHASPTHGPGASASSTHFRYMATQNPLTVPLPPQASTADPPLFDFGVAAFVQDGSLPQEFLSVFLGSGFDPLDGAITNSASPQLDMFDFTTMDNHYLPGANLGSLWGPSS